MNEKTASVLLAIYNPDIKWLTELYESLNSQTYKNIKIYIRDDCSTSISFDELKRLTEILKMPYEVNRNEKNIGSTKTFEVLTAEASGEYFSYCDQDDIWLCDKTEKLIAAVEKNNGALAYCDFYIADENMRLQKQTKTKFYEGYDLWKILLYRNFFPGCVMLIDSRIAKKCLPFDNNLIHDQWLALNAAIDGKIVFVNERLLKYRIHSDNQTGYLKNATSKQTYYDNRIKKQLDTLTGLLERFRDNRAVTEEIEKGIEIDKARAKYFKGDILSAFKAVEYYRISKKTILFELVCALCPESVFKIILNKLRQFR